MYFTYILFSASLRRYYVGSTNDVQKRLHEHNAGKSLSTRAGMPWQLVLSESFPTRPEAVRRERQIKARGIGRYLADVTAVGQR